MADVQTAPSQNSEVLSQSLSTDLNKLPGFLKTQEKAGEEAVKAKVEADVAKTGAELGAKREALEQISAEDKAHYEEVKKEMKPAPEFKPTKDNALELGAIFSMIATMGVALGGSGKLSGINALNSMGGMLKGYQQGRKDLFAKEQATFDKEMASMKASNDALIKDLEQYQKLRVTDKEAAMLKAGEISAKNPGVIAAQINAGRADNALEVAKANSKLQTEIMSKAMKTGISGGSRSAINERFQNTVLRSGNEILRSLGLLEQIGIDTGGGALGGVVGKGTITSELAANLGRALTSDEQKAYNAAAGGMALELAYVLNGGYKPNQGQIDELRNLYMATPQDNLGTAAYKFADVAAKLKAALEVAPDYTPEQKLYKKQILDKLNQYAPPEVVYERQFGQPVRQEPAVRADGGVTPTPVPTQKPTPARSDIDYYKQNKTPEMKKRFIDRFGVDPDTLG